VAKERASRSSGRQVLLIKANDVIDRDQTGLDIRLVSDCWTVEGAQQELGIGFYGMEVELIGGQPALP
jgi:hypothetical protein